MAKLKPEYPSNAFKVNGYFIEDLVPGYHTLNAQGKWTAEKELFTAGADIRDGSIFVNSRYPAREIEIEYFIEGTGWADLQDKFTKLMKVLDVEDAEIIFNGESDKFMRGYFVIDDNIETTVITRSGTFMIYCMDPFKYSTTEKVVQAVSNQWTIAYDGTFKTFPTFITKFPDTENGDGESTETSQCGFVGFVNQAGKILQFGDPNQVDWADVQYPATIPVNRVFKTTSGWTVNGSQVIYGTQTGSISTNATDKYAYPSGYGTGTNYHGPSFSKLITGETAPIGKNFNFRWVQKFLGTKEQFGGFECLLWRNDSGTRTLVGGVRIMKTTKDTKCKVYMYVGSTTNKGSFTVECSKIGTCTMQKIGKKITFGIGGKTYSYSSNNIADLVANEITFHFMKNGTKTALGTNRLYSVKLQRLSFSNYEDVANIFMPGDVLTVNTQDAGVYLDDGSATIQATYLGALGNDWEEFALVPGTNVIVADYSDFTTDPPEFEIRYRERFL